VIQIFDLRVGNAAEIAQCIVAIICKKWQKKKVGVGTSVGD